MSTRPGDSSNDDSNDDDGTVLRPRRTTLTGADLAGSAAQDSDEATVLVSRPVGSSTGPTGGRTGGDPHTPTLSAASMKSGVAAVGNALPIGTYLGEFELTQVVGEGGFGIVYLAVDHSLQRKVALKEYMPSSLAERTDGMQVSSQSPDDEETFRKGLDSFINEARLLAQFDHPSLVKVHRFWEANGTAYMVMPFYEGPTLKDTLRDMGSPPDETWLRTLLDPLTGALAVIHGQQCFHRDIAPDNILLLAGSGRPLLLDFGAARRVIGDANQALTVILKPGYAPVEQYAEVPSMKQGPWTDVYALAAVLYFAIMGKKPPAAVGRLINDQYQPLVKQAAGRYSEPFLKAIDDALAVKPNERTQNIDAFRAAMGFGTLARDAAGVLSDNGMGSSGNFDTTRRLLPPSPAPAALPTSTPAGQRPGAGGAPAGGGLGLKLGAGAAALLVAGGAWWFLGRGTAPVPPAPAAGNLATSAPGTSAPTGAAAPAASAIAAAPPPVSAPAALPAAAPFSVASEFQRIVAQQSAGFSVSARVAKASFRLFDEKNTSAKPDPIALSITSAQDGYFYVLAHAPDGQLLLYYPNDEAPTNRITAGKAVTLPGTGKDPKTGKAHMGLEFTEPPGKAELLVLVSRQPRDFGPRVDNGQTPWRQFPTGQTAESMARQFGPTGSLYAGKPVCPAGPACADEYGASVVEFSVVR